jgi:hypothetical protein
MAAAKEALVVVADVGRTMCEGGGRKKDIAVRATLQIIQQKVSAKERAGNLPDAPRLTPLFLLSPADGVRRGEEGRGQRHHGRHGR